MFLEFLVKTKEVGKVWSLLEALRPVIGVVGIAQNNLQLRLLPNLPIDSNGYPWSWIPTERNWVAAVRSGSFYEIHIYVDPDIVNSFLRLLKEIQSSIESSGTQLYSIGFTDMPSALSEWIRHQLEETVIPPRTTKNFQKNPSYVPLKKYGFVYEFFEYRFQEEYKEPRDSRHIRLYVLSPKGQSLPFLLDIDIIFLSILVEIERLMDFAYAYIDKHLLKKV